MAGFLQEKRRLSSKLSRGQVENKQIEIVIVDGIAGYQDFRRLNQRQEKLKGSPL